jgi:hypothetical protein
LDTGSAAEFITEHYWGYVTQRDGGTMQYRVEHPRWNVWTAGHAALTGPIDHEYGGEFARVLTAPPVSAFVAEGSAVAVYPGRKVADPV